MRVVLDVALADDTRLLVWQTPWAGNSDTFYLKSTVLPPPLCWPLLCTPILITRWSTSQRKSLDIDVPLWERVLT
jgi:hypothetical protein